MEFVNRAAELEELESALSSPDAVLYRLVGRRRIGKTALLAQAVRRHGGIYLFAPEGDEVQVLAELRRQASEAAGAGSLPPEGWAGLFRYLEQFEGRPVVLDEFQHVLKASPTAVSLLQQAWDTRLRRRKTKLFLCGSSIGMMRRLTLGATGALFGRLTHDVRLRPFGFRHVGLLYPHLSDEEVLRRYAVFGGTPHYHSFSVGEKDLRQAIRRSFLASSGPFRQEPLDLLRYELKQPGRYHGILDAVGHGKRELEEIRAKLGFGRVGDITRYVQYLRDDLGLVVSDAPVPEGKPARRLRFTDPFFLFYYRFVADQLPALELGAEEGVLEKIDAEFPAHVGTVAETVLHELLVERNGKALAGHPVRFTRLGRWWGTSSGEGRTMLEADAVAIGPDEVVLGEVKWGGEPLREGAWDRLLDIAASIPLPAKLRRRFIIVSKAGFSPAFKAKAPSGSILLEGKEFLRLARAG